MAEQESVGMVEEMVEETIEKVTEEVEEMAAPASPAASEPEEKPWMFGQTPSMWFLIDSAVVLLIVLIMRLTA